MYELCCLRLSLSFLVSHHPRIALCSGHGYLSHRYPYFSAYSPRCIILYCIATQLIVSPLAMDDYLHDYIDSTVSWLPHYTILYSAVASSIPHAPLPTHLLSVTLLPHMCFYLLLTDVVRGLALCLPSMGLRCTYHRRLLGVSDRRARRRNRRGARGLSVSSSSRFPLFRA